MTINSGFEKPCLRDYSLAKPFVTLSAPSNSVSCFIFLPKYSIDWWGNEEHGKDLRSLKKFDFEVMILSPLNKT